MQNQKVEALLEPKSTRKSSTRKSLPKSTDKVNQKVIAKVIDARLRRKADRQGLILHKSPRRTPDAIDYGLFSLCDVQTGDTIHPEGLISPYALTLEDVEEYLKR